MGERFMDERNRERILKLKKKIYCSVFYPNIIWTLVKKTVEFWGHLFL